MAIRPPKHNFQGFTLLEMLTVIGIFSIMMGIAVPSLISLNKPLRDGVSQFKSHLGLVRSKAISSTQAYRIMPMFTSRAEYKNGIPGKFIVEYAANCTITTGWQRASQFDLELPDKVGITDISTTTLSTPASVTVSNNLNWNSGQGLCFDNRGIVDKTVRFVVKDFQGFGKAQIALFDISKVGGAEIYLYNKNNVIVDNY